MGVITRQEAAHRLRIIASLANSGVSAARDGNWREAFSQAYDLRDALNKLMPHLEEAAEAAAEGLLPGFSEADNVGSLAYNPPPQPRRTGGMGYRGNGYSGSTTSTPTPSRPAVPVRQDHVAFDAPKANPVSHTSSTSGDGIWNPLSEIIADIAKAKAERTPTEPTPIITPAPEAEPRVFTFDLARIPGMNEYQDAFATAPPLTAEEVETAKVFKGLPVATREKITTECRKQGKPVRVRLKVTA